MNRKAAMELSMGTIVVVVLSVSMLILGMILVRSIMCAGMQISEDISSGVRNEVKNLFGADKFGVKCMGEGGQDVKLGTGGRRKVVCIIKSEEQSTYQLIATKIESLKGASTDVVQKWVLNKEWSGSVSPGTDKEVDVVLLDIPRNAPTSTLKITIQANKGAGSSDTITSIIDIVPTGFVKGAIC
ncbi:MAG: hypothetical protein N3D20_02055 [Candidatus Pacearchaeota archaeon]|nr:hypothetical protein [Candidatus Pacearchaeota archaeon]